MDETERFLHQLFDGKPSETAIQLWRKSDRKAFYYSQLDPAASWARSIPDDDIYVAAGLAARVNQPSRRRVPAREVIGIPGIWADLDVNGGPEGKTGAAPSIDEALDLAEALLTPTLLIHSGYGVQAWWLLEEPWVFTNVAEREQAARIVMAFQGALKAEAKDRGYSIDSTFDLARLMRLPGTQNCKGEEPVKVRLLEDDGPRHELEALHGVGSAHMNASALAVSLVTGEGVDIEVRPDAGPPGAKFLELSDLIPEFRDSWEHRGRARQSWSMSQWEMSLTNYAVRAGWTDQEVADLIVFHRLKYEPGDPKGKNRPERIRQTIGKARSDIQFDPKEEEHEREQAIEQLATIGASSSDGAADPIRAMALFNKILDVPEIKEIVQTGTDPDTCRYKLVLASGDDVPLGPMRGLMDQQTFRANFAVVTGKLPKRVKAAKWDEVIQALLDSRRIEEADEDNRAQRAIGWLEAYTERRVSTDRNAACQAYDPWVREGVLGVPLGPFHQYLRKVRGERLAEPDVKQLLVAAGFERRTVNYQRDDGKKSSRSYYVAPADVVPTFASDAPHDAE